MTRALPGTAIIAVVALLLAWVVVQNAVVRATAEAAPAFALHVAPGDPTALIASTGYDGQPLKPPTQRQLAVLDEAARGDPLYFEPFLARAVAVAARGDHRRAIRLAIAARSRDPRAVSIHLLLLEEYARTGDVPAAVAVLNPLVALAGGTGPDLASTLNVLAGDRQGAAILAAALRRSPSWRYAFLQQAKGASQSLAFQTLVSPPKGTSEYDQRQDRTSFLERLTDAGDYERAYLAWVNFLPGSEAGRADAVYDGSFQGLPGLQPFNWTLTNNELASAERRDDSSLPGRTALNVNFFGSQTTPIASELLLVQPGSYIFSLIGTADAGGVMAGNLRWQLQCLPSDAITPLVTISTFKGQLFKVMKNVTIPSTGCVAQRLSLIGNAGDVSTLIHAQFTALELTAR